MLPVKGRTRLCSGSHGRDRKGAVTGVRWPVIRSRLHDKLVHASFVWKINLLLMHFINFSIPNTVAVWLLKS